MATVYTAIPAFENSARDLVGSAMIEAKGKEWWSGVSAEIRAETRLENEAKHKIHAQRGDAPLKLHRPDEPAQLIRANGETFEALLPSVDWTARRH